MFQSMVGKQISFECTSSADVKEKRSKLQETDEDLEDEQVTR